MRFKYCACCPSEQISFDGKMGEVTFSNPVGKNGVVLIAFQHKVYGKNITPFPISRNRETISNIYACGGRRN